MGVSIAMNLEKLRIPASVVRRLPRYLLYTQRACGEGAEWVSSLEMAAALGLTSSTVRQDLSHVDCEGISKRGYAKATLAAALARALGADREINLAIVGAGNFGCALAQNEMLSRNGFWIRGLFDNDARLVGRRVGALTVQPMTELRAAIKAQRVEIGVLAVPAAAAQEVADRLVAAGVLGLMNLTAARPAIPAKVSMVDVRLVASLQELAYAIKVRKLAPVVAGAQLLRTTEKTDNKMERI